MVGLKKGNKQTKNSHVYSDYNYQIISFTICIQKYIYIKNLNKYISGLQYLINIGDGQSL